MTFSKGNPPVSAAVQQLFSWLAVLLSSEQAYATWIGLDQSRRSSWLDDEGYDETALRLGLQHYAEDPTADPLLLSSLKGWMTATETVSEELREALLKLLIAQLSPLKVLAGGIGSNGVLNKHGLSSSQRNNIHNSANQLLKLRQEAVDSRLGTYVEITGGLEARAAEHVSNQVGRKRDEATTLLNDAQEEAKAFKNQMSRRIENDKKHFINTKENLALQQEEPYLEARKSDNSLPYITNHSSEYHNILKLDKKYFQETYESTLKKDLIVPPVFSKTQTSTVAGSTTTWSVSLDWQGARGSVDLNRTTTEGGPTSWTLADKSGGNGIKPSVELGPTLYAFNRLTAEALWHAQVENDITKENKQLKALSQNNSTKSGLLLQAVLKRNPKAKLPNSRLQLAKDKQTLIKESTSSVQHKVHKAKRHGVTLFSLQRHRDI